MVYDHLNDKRRYFYPVIIRIKGFKFIITITGLSRTAENGKTICLQLFCFFFYFLHRINSKCQMNNSGMLFLNRIILIRQECPAWSSVPALHPMSKLRK